MEDLKKLAEALPQIKSFDHYENLKARYANSEWHGVDDYVSRVMCIANERIHRQVVIGSIADNKKKVGLIERIKNKFKK
jgi:hypothetical protein